MCWLCVVYACTWGCSVPSIKLPRSCPPQACTHSHTKPRSLRRGQLWRARRLCHHDPHHGGLSARAVAVAALRSLQIRLCAAPACWLCVAHTATPASRTCSLAFVPTPLHATHPHAWDEGLCGSVAATLQKRWAGEARAIHSCCGCAYPCTRAPTPSAQLTPMRRT